MHVLFLIDQLVCAGGTELHLWDLATGLVTRGIRVSVVSFDDGAFAGRFVDDAEIEYHCLNAPCINNLQGFKAILWLHKYLRRGKVDIIQSFHTASDLVAPVLGLFSHRRTKVISSRRDLGYTKSKKHIFLHKFLNKFVKIVLANSEQVKLAVLASETIPSEKIRVIYNGICADKISVDSNFSRNEYRRCFGIPPDCLLIGALGNSRPVKGFPDLIQSAKILSKTNRDVCFAVAGESDDLKDLIDSLDLSSRFFLLGPLRDVGKYLNALDIYVQPSHSEGFSNAIIEAMLAKLPVIVSDVGGNVEIVSHGEDGLLFQSKNIEDLIDKINLLLNDKNLAKEIAINAHKKVADSFLIERMLDDYCDLYDGV